MTGYLNLLIINDDRFRGCGRASGPCFSALPTVAQSSSPSTASHLRQADTRYKSPAARLPALDEGRSA
jgi:hypothetical protein